MQVSCLFYFCSHGPCRRFRGDQNDEDTRTFCGKFLYRQCNCTTQELSFQSRAIPGRDLFNLGCWRDRPFLNRTHLVFDEVIPISRQHDRTPSRQHDRTPTVGNTTGSRQHDRTPTKIASALENFPATVIMPSAWPDWSKFQLLRSWHDPAGHEASALTTRPHVRYFCLLVDFSKEK